MALVISGRQQRKHALKYQDIYSIPTFFFSPMATEVAYLYGPVINTTQCLLSGEWAKASVCGSAKDRKYFSSCAVELALLLLVLILSLSF